MFMLLLLCFIVFVLRDEWFCQSQCIHAVVVALSFLPVFTPAAVVVGAADPVLAPAVIAGALPACRIFCRSSALGIATPP